MSKEFLAKVFDAFERETTSKTSNIEGSGLGLAITKRLVDAMGGTISCRSELGKGTEFICRFKFRIGSKTDLPNEQADDGAALDVHGKRVLLVEDNELNREISHELLTSEGFEVEEADDGDVAIEKVKNSAPGYFDSGADGRTDAAHERLRRGPGDTRVGRQGASPDTHNRGHGQRV